MQLVRGSERIEAGSDVSPVEGTVRWAPKKSLWIGGMTAAALLGAPVYFSWSALALFLVTTGVTLCFGHSVGMHRRLIHASFETPRWVEYSFVYLGTLVGMAGPLGMVRLHDFRDWAQRQQACHDFFCHRRGFWHDAWWQLHCELQLVRPPVFRPEQRLAQDRFYRRLDAAWMLQQVPWAVIFYLIGGIPWLVWGICARIAVSVTGHWMVGHFAHRCGPQTWMVRGAAAQGYNVPIAGLISMGESWHNNHHAFPGSARLGLLRGEADPGWWLICWLQRLGLAWDIRTPDQLPFRPELIRLSTPSRYRSDGYGSAV